MAFGDLRGHYAFVAMHNDHEDTLVAARKECPLIVGLGEDENFVASAIPAFLAQTRRALGHQERRDRHRPQGRRHRDGRRRQRRRRPRADRGHLGRGRRREGRLRHLHAQGDPRAARRRRRDDHRPAADAGRGRPLRRRPRRRVPEGHRADRDRRLRDLLPLRPRRSLRDRAVGARPGRDGHRLRVPLPRAGPPAQRPGHRHHPVRRDRRHARGDAAGARRAARRCSRSAT